MFSAKGARFNASLGQRPRIHVTERKAPALKARLNLELASVPNIPLIIINAVPAKQLAVFLLKGASTMVLLLRLDILHYGIELTRTH